MRRARLVSGIGVIVLVGCLIVIATSLARREAARAGEAGCAGLGNAAAFVVFSDGAFNASQASGTTISGRIAAAGDVTLDSISVSPAAGDSTPTVIAGGNFIAGRTTGHGGTLNGASDSAARSTWLRTSPSTASARTRRRRSRSCPRSAT